VKYLREILNTVEEVPQIIHVIPKINSLIVYGYGDTRNCMLLLQNRYPNILALTQVRIFILNLGKYAFCKSYRKISSTGTIRMTNTFENVSTVVHS